MVCDRHAGALGGIVVTIEEFIEARIAERDKAANEAIRLETIWADDNFELGYEWVRFLRSPSGQVMSSMFVAGAPAPREVLRQCAANRTLLEQYLSARRRFPAPPPDDEAYSRSDIEAMAAFDTLRVLVRYTAAVWSDHPDYQERWAI